MPFSYDQIEDTLVTYLTEKMPDQVIAAYPDNEAGYLDVKDKPVIYVAYTESEFDPTTSTSITKQKEKPLIICNIRATKRKGVNGVNGIILLLFKFLQGLQITGSGCERLQLESSKLVERDEDRKVWSWNVVFSTSKNQHQQIEDLDIPLTTESTLKEVIFNDTVQLPE